MKKIKLVVVGLAVSVALSGCSGIMFLSGYNRGKKDYAKIKKGDMIGMRRAGYLVGIAEEIKNDYDSGNIIELQTGLMKLQEKITK